jgi:hypothetical protein
LDLLVEIVESKSLLILKAIGAESIEIVVREDKIAFLWFTLAEAARPLRLPHIPPLS